MDPYRSAKAILPHVWRQERFKSPTVVDVGCGDAGFLRAARDLGARYTLGLDQATNPPAAWDGEYLCQDLRTAVPASERTFSLAICVEVAEHLEEQFAPGLVAFVTSLAPLVLWSAAIPDQGPHPPEGATPADLASGAWHVNERWPAYWSVFFREQGYFWEDEIQAAINDDPEVDPWYKSGIRIYRKAYPQ